MSRRATCAPYRWSVCPVPLTVRGTWSSRGSEVGAAGSSTRLVNSAARWARRNFITSRVYGNSASTDEVIQNEELVRLFKYHCGSVDGRLFWYEDIVDAAPHHVDLWSDMMVKLGLWKAPDPERVRNRAAASTHAVHATLPLSDVVANWGELAEALGGSVFEDMLA